MTAAVLRACVGCTVLASLSSGAIERCHWMATLHFNVVPIVLQGTHRDGCFVGGELSAKVSAAHFTSRSPSLAGWQRP